MLHFETLAPETLVLLREIQTLSAFKDTRLVRGAALGLHFGHRTSMDLDLFGSWEPNPPLELALSKCGAVEKTGGDGGTFQFFKVNGVKIDCVSYPYKWLAPAVVTDGIRLAGIPDIAAMKIAAVTNRGTRKDFVDVYFLLQRYSLEQLLDLYQAKYPDGNVYLALRSLVYFADAEEEVMPKVLHPIEWEKIKTAIQNAVREFAT